MADEKRYGYLGKERRDDDLTELRMRIDQCEKDCIRREQYLQQLIDEIRNHFWPAEGPTIREQIIILRARTDRIPWLFGVLGVLATLGIGFVALFIK